MSTAKKSFEFCQLFEAELLLELMLRFWAHPKADDADYRAALLNTTADVLQAAAQGQAFIEGVPPQAMNFVAAVYYAEWTSQEDDKRENGAIDDKRVEWLEKLRHSLPSCFCDPNLLD